MAPLTTSNSSQKSSFWRRLGTRVFGKSEAERAIDTAVESVYALSRSGETRGLQLYNTAGFSKSSQQQTELDPWPKAEKDLSEASRYDPGYSAVSEGLKKKGLGQETVYRQLYRLTPGAQWGNGPSYSS
jgi:hypothetical protein